VENNRIGNADLGAGTSIAIDIVSSSNVFVSNNRVIKMNYGIWYHFGSSSGKFRDNLTSDAPFPGVHSGTDAGGNN
jgi:parallel beta-helix repeat protein